MKITIIFDNFGPYHYARLEGSALSHELTAVQISTRSTEYAWKNQGCETGFKLVTLFSEQTSRDARTEEIAQKICEALDASQPDVVFIPGWSSRAAFAALDWCVRRDVPAVSMSESTAWDEKRVAWKEWVKRNIVSLISAALVGGRAHGDYLIKLGMSSERIFLGYDVVDNHYFSSNAAEARNDEAKVRENFTLPENYFLASARFIEKKNLSRLIEAFALYRSMTQKPQTPTTHPRPWSLVLLGDGAMRQSLESQISSLKLQGQVLLPGFIQYPDLPAYYALAGAFVHASTVEPWGLVVNEAMASGLPVLVSDSCGCASELVQDGQNGFTFDPYNIENLANLMVRLSQMELKSRMALGSESLRIIAQWGPKRFADGVNSAAQRAIQNRPIKASKIKQLLLKGLQLK